MSERLKSVAVNHQSNAQKGEHKDHQEDHDDPAIRSEATIDQKAQQKQETGSDSDHREVYFLNGIQIAHRDEEEQQFQRAKPVRE